MVDDDAKRFKIYAGILPMKNSAAILLMYIGMYLYVCTYICKWLYIYEVGN